MAYTIFLHLGMWWFLAGDAIALQCVATATASLPPSAVQNSEGRGGTLPWQQGDSEYIEQILVYLLYDSD
jgi:hypothetical protein